jgi:murE/murF fusion protein
VDCRIVGPHADESRKECQITSISSDSRTVAAGSLFVALPGVESDGHNYLENAIANGCAAVLCESGRIAPQQIRDWQVVVVETPDTYNGYAAVAANFFERPADCLTFVGVTGTNGKTTVTYLLEQVLLRAGFSVGVIGTVNNRYTLKNGEKRITGTRFTTPEAFLLQQLLREMVDQGVEYVVMEVSSHALAQQRIGEIPFAVAAFTNLTRDHLDYHLDMEEYFRAKTKLFSGYLAARGTAVLPVLDDRSENPSWLRSLHEICVKGGRKIISWGDSEKAMVSIASFTSRLSQTDLVVRAPGGKHVFSTPLVGRYNIDNILTVVAISCALRLNESLVCQALAEATGAPGRLERVTAGDNWPSLGPVVFVDYAHTPDALEKVLTTVGALPHRQLIGVFGCGGDRDKGKRAVMGEIAARLCDVAVVTDDNPRTEDPDRIVEQIVGGIAGGRAAVKDPSWLTGRSISERGCTVIRDRRTAIDMAIRAGGPDDIVVIAGKGHEPYQLTIQGKRFFDDRMEAGNVLLSWTDQLAAEAVCGELQSGSRAGGLLGPIVTDSRTATSGGLFVALRGENHDAHDFAEQAVANGAACLLVERVPASLAAVDVSRIIVPDTQQALGDLAAFRRRRLATMAKQTIIGITGSCGKTTVKEMVAAILARKWPEGPDNPAGCVLKTKGNFNNIIGLPLSLLPLDLSHKAAVLEMGMNRPGELSRLAEIADPDISIITNIHGAHLEGLGSIEGVAKAKEELFAGTRQTGVLVINLDDEWVRNLAEKYPQRRITFATTTVDHDQPPDFWASDVAQDNGGALSFTMHRGDETAEIHLFTAGEHNIANALAAAATASAAGAGIAEIVAGLADFRPADKRMEILRTRAGFTVINDTYNANPASMAAGLKTLKQMAGKSATAIIGDMRELGESSGRAHFEIGRLLAELAIDRVAVVGAYREDVQRGAIAHGLARERIRTFADKEAASAWIKEMIAAKKIGKEDLILVKASRGLRFETIVTTLIEAGG